MALLEGCREGFPKEVPFEQSVDGRRNSAGRDRAFQGVGGIMSMANLHWGERRSSLHALSTYHVPGLLL